MKYVVKDESKTKFLNIREIIYPEIIHQALLEIKSELDESTQQLINQFDNEIRKLTSLSNYFFYLDNFNVKTNYWVLSIPYSFAISKTEINIEKEILRNNLSALEKISKLSKKIFNSARLISQKTILERKNISNYRLSLEEIAKTQKILNEKLKNNRQFYLTEEYRKIADEMQKTRSEMGTPNKYDLLFKFRQPFSEIKNKEILALTDADNWNIEVFSEENDLYASCGYALIGPSGDEVRYANRNGDFTATIGGARLFETQKQASHWAKLKGFRNYIIVKIKTQLETVVEDHQGSGVLGMVQSMLDKKDINKVFDNINVGENKKKTGKL